MRDSYGRCGHCHLDVIPGMECEEPECPFAQLAKENAPTQYALLHHAAQLARQLEAAGLPEGHLTVDALEYDPVEDVDLENVEFRTLFIHWPKENGPPYVWVLSSGTYRAGWSLAPHDFAVVKVGDPLPPALIDAIRETAT